MLVCVFVEVNESALRVCVLVHVLEHTSNTLLLERLNPAPKALIMFVKEDELNIDHV